MQAAVAMALSRLFAADSISASKFSFGFNLKCELIYFLYFNQFVLFDVNLLVCFIVSVCLRRFRFKSCVWSDDRSGSDSALMRDREIQWVCLAL